MLSVIEKSINNNGYIAKSYNQVPNNCQFVLSYVAYQKWDGTAFLSQAAISLRKDNQLIGDVLYKTPNGIFGGGGINPEKWSSTESKISPLMDQLLKI